MFASINARCNLNSWRLAYIFFVIATSKYTYKNNSTRSTCTECCTAKKANKARPTCCGFAYSKSNQRNHQYACLFLLLTNTMYDSSRATSRHAWWLLKHFKQECWKCCCLYSCCGSTVYTSSQFCICIAFRTAAQSSSSSSSGSDGGGSRRVSVAWCIMLKVLPAAKDNKGHESWPTKRNIGADRDFYVWFFGIFGKKRVVFLFFFNVAQLSNL